MNKITNALCLFVMLVLASPARSASPTVVTMRVHDLIDGFLSYEQSSLQIGTAETPDQIVPWAQGDIGDSSIEVVSIDGKSRKQNLYIYQQGVNGDESLHDAGAFGGAKIVSLNAVAAGVDCEQGPQVFRYGYIGVEPGQTLCIKTRSGTNYAIVQVLAIGKNGIRLGVMAGAQPSSRFSPL